MYDDFKGTEPKKTIWQYLPSPKLIGIAAVIILLLLVKYFITLKLDYTWFDVLGYSSVFWRSFQARLLMGPVIFSLTALLSFINLFLVYRMAGKPFRIIITLPLTILAAVLVTGNAGDLWLDVLKSFYAVPFGISDPQFQQDLGFYVFRLPLLWLIYRLVLTWFTINLLITVPLYFFLLFRGNLETAIRDVTRPLATSKIRRGLAHVGVFLGLILAWQAVQYKLSTYELLYSQQGSVIGAGAADVGARLPVYNLMMVLSLVLGAVVLVFFSRRLKLAFMALAAYFLIMVAATGFYPGIYQKLIVDPDELGQEKPYLERNIQYTNRAYGLDNITEIEYPVGELKAADISGNRDIIDNMRLLDHRATKTTYGQQQEIRLYYDFIDVDVDRYMINGKLTQVLLSGRELNRKSLPEQAQTFNNLLFKYTHGFGLVMSPANTFTEAGLPQYLIKDIPPQSPLLKLEQPRIYFGEATGDNVIVNNGLKEFDYPVGNDNQDYDYTGNLGIPMTFLNKLLLTYRDVQFKYMLSDYIGPQSQYLETRNVKERAARIAPFLLYDQDPYIVLGKDGRLYYIIDAYTYTNRYPYSQAVNDGALNYMRNSVKTVVDAYSGKIDFYIFDSQDPLIQVYRNIYPGLFKDAQDFPADLKDHVRYPEDLFTVQSLVLRDYHMANPTVFYNREDRWELAQETYSGEKEAQAPYYSIIRLPGEKQEEYVLMRSFNPVGKQNMVAWLAGRCDGDNYGKMLLYKFPKGTQIPGTLQVESEIDQEPDISSQLSLWGQGGSRVLRGNLLVYPISGSLIYVEPLYIQSEQNKFPQLKKVLVYYKDKIVMEDTLEKALTSLFGTGTQMADQPGIQPEKPGPQGPASNQDLIKRLISLHKESREKLKAGDWSAYGQLQKEIDQVISQLEGSSS